MIPFSKVIAFFSSPISWVLLIGCLLRLYSAIARCIVNPDAVRYINQAQAIFSGEWSNLFTCNISFLSSYPFFIAAVFTFLRDWIAAGVLINVCFGSATLVPLYYLLQRFVNKTTCVITVLIYALMPTFVNSSSDIVRGPVFWFFLTSGMLMFVRQWDEGTKDGRYRYDLLLCSICFLLATWTRIEGILFLAVSLLYLLITKTNQKKEKIFFFLFPFILISLVTVIAFLFSETDITTVLRAKQIFQEATQFLSHYSELDAQIKTLYSEHTRLLGEFLRRVREALWLMPFAILFHNIIEVFFYPFALIYFIGFIGIRQRLQQNRHVWFFLWLSLTSIGMLCIHLVQTWIFIHRFLAILIYSSCIVMAYGVDTVNHYFQKKYQLQQITAISILVSFILLFSLPKNLKPREIDKIIYRQASQIIEQHKDSRQVTRIAAAHASRAYEWVFLYSHRHYPGLLCAKHLIGHIPDSYDQFITDMDNADINYMLYEERYWPKNKFDFLASPFQRHYQLLGQWQHPDSGLLMLFKRIAGKID